MSYQFPPIPTNHGASITGTYRAVDGAERKRTVGWCDCGWRDRTRSTASHSLAMASWHRHLEHHDVGKPLSLLPRDSDRYLTR